MTAAAAADSRPRSNEPPVDALDDSPPALLVTEAARDLWQAIRVYLAHPDLLDDNGPEAAATEAEVILADALSLCGAAHLCIDGDGVNGWSVKASGPHVDVLHWVSGAAEPDFADRLTPMAALALAERILVADGDVGPMDVELMVASGALAVAS